MSPVRLPVRLLGASVVIVMILLLVLAPCALRAADAPTALVSRFDQPFQFSYLAWQDKITVADGRARIHGVTNQGGAGCTQAMDLSAVPTSRLALHLRAGAGNRAAGITVLLVDAAGHSARWLFSLQGVTETGTTVLPQHGGDLLHPDAREKGDLDLAHLMQWQLSGDWAGNLPMEVDVDSILLVAAADAPARADPHQEPGAASEQEAQRVRALRAAGVAHPADGAVVVHVGAVAPDILAIEIQSGTYLPHAYVPYQAQAGDARSEGEKAWVVRAGTMVEELVGQTITRTGADGRRRTLGPISSDGKWVCQPDGVAGTLLDTALIDAPAAYEIRSHDDPTYATPGVPVAVWRKSKPNAPQLTVIGHQVFLKLRAPLREGATYTVRFAGLATRVETISYTHDTRTVRSDAIHANQLGFRPGDPFKRGYYSIWLGTGGGYQLADLTHFELIDARSGATVFTGTAELGKALDAPEALQAQKNYCKTAVYWLDFSAVTTPGTYKLRIPGIGTSYPFPLADGIWEGAYRIGMRGILSQRSGVALGPPFLDFTRPRPCHPDDGVKFYQIDIGIDQGQEGPRGEALLKHWKAHRSLDEVTNIWGGYQDGGDWDVYTTTLATADLLTEAFDLAPDSLRQQALSLPANEATNAIPDLLDEALWGVACFTRLQLPSGAVRDGFGDGWGARPGDVSWNDSNPVCVYAASTDTSWYYAACAANMARLLARYDAPQAAALRESAVHAWTWAEAHASTAAAAPAERQAPRWLAAHAREAYAAVALYWLTHEKAYHERFMQVCELQEATNTAYAGGWIEPFQQGDATFTYARLPTELADARLQANARSCFVLAGNIAVRFMAGNGFNLPSSLPGIPVMDFCGYYTNPGMNSSVVRAHALTHDPRYLAAVIASANFRLGANPDNRCFTTGLGPNPIRYPLKIDSQLTGQAAPVGLTVYGPSDQSMPGGSDWVHQWLLTPEHMVPGSRTWPAPESYVDMWTWPGANEYCVNAPVAQSVYTSCYLAGRP